MPDRAPDPSRFVTTLDELQALYGEPGEASLVKEVDRVVPEYRAFIEASPFVAIATSGPGGLDCSPRGDAPGFVRVLDERTLALPDRRGNNRLDTLRNVVADPRVALLFLVPGAGETIRVNGRAAISVEPKLLASLAVDGKAPRTVLLVAVERVYFQCSRALSRSRLWDPALHVDRRSLPSAGAMLAACSEGRLDGAAYDRELPARLLASLY